MKYHKSLIICFSLSVLISLSACVHTSKMDNSSPGAATVPLNNTPESSEITNFPKLGLSVEIIQELSRFKDKYHTYLQITKILEGGSADKVGIKSGDVISLVEPFPGVQHLRRGVSTVKDVIRNLEHYEEGDVVNMEILSKMKDRPRIAQIFYVKIEASENNNDTTGKYIERPRTFYPRRQSNAEYRSWNIGLLESERYKKVLAISNSLKLAASRRHSASQAQPATSIGRVEGNETRIIAQISEHAKNWQNDRALESVNQFFAKIDSMSNDKARYYCDEVFGIEDLNVVISFPTFKDKLDKSIIRRCSAVHSANFFYYRANILSPYYQLARTAQIKLETQKEIVEYLELARQYGNSDAERILAQIAAETPATLARFRSEQGKKDPRLIALCDELKRTGGADGIDERVVEGCSALGVDIKSYAP